MPHPYEDNPESSALRLAAANPLGRLVLLAWKRESSTSVREVVLYRSTTDIQLAPLETTFYPVTVRKLEAVSSCGLWADEEVADGTNYFYQIRITHSNGTHEFSNVARVCTAPRALPALHHPNILVDKENYYLEVREGGASKRFPIALGASPHHRKICQDRSSTPEGQYFICGVQPHAQYYRAYDVSYPNQMDWQRYQQARALGQAASGIGGDIQIHGRGIVHNWTWGCIALRDQDMDELFSHAEIRCGVPITIVGREFTRIHAAMQPLPQEALSSIK